MTQRPARTLVGVDLGGTSIRAAVALGAGAHGDPVVRDTPAQKGADAVLDAVAEAARAAAGENRISGLAIGFPGPLDPRTGVVHDAPNLPGFSGLDARAALRDRLGCAVSVQNDARLATYAEWRHGAGVGVEDLLFVTVSTGIGGGAVVGGRLMEGAGGTAGEMGHVSVAGAEGRRCAQGHPGCLEGVASGTAIAARAVEALARGAESSLRSVAPGHVDARAVTAAAEAGDALSMRLVTEAGHALGHALGGYVNVFAPAVLVIGGGLIHAGDLLLEPARAAMPEMAFRAALDRCRLCVAALGTDAGLVGATSWAWDVVAHSL